MFSVLIGILGNAVYDSINLRNIEKKLIECYERAEKNFYKKYGNKYGDEKSSFLVREDNINVVVKSFFYNIEELSFNDFIPNSFDGYDNPSKDAIIDFINMIKAEVNNDFELVKLLVEKKHIIEQKEEHSLIISKIDNLNEKLEFKELEKRISSLEQSLRLTNENNNSNVNSLIISNEIETALRENSIHFDKETKIYLNDDSGNIEGQLIVRYTDFLSNFKNFSELLNYSYYTQKVIKLEPIVFRLKLGNRSIYEKIYAKDFSGRSVGINFTSYSEISIIAEEVNKSIDYENQTVVFEIHPPKLDYFKVSIENGDYEQLLSNIELKIISRKMTEENHINVILANNDQVHASVNISFIMKFNNNKVVNTTVNFKPMRKNVALDHFRFLNFMKKISQQESIVVRNLEDDKILFEGKIDVQWNKNIEEDIEIIKKILNAEKKLGVTFNLTEIISKDDIEDIINLNSILCNGKLEMPSLTVKIDYEDKIEDITSNKTYMFTFVSDDKYKVFGQELDLGEQIIILSKVEVSKLDKNTLELKTLQGSRNLHIYRKFYGDYTIEKIFEIENIGIIQQSDVI